MDVSKALELWVEITGVSPNDTTIRLRDLDIHRANSVLKKSLEFDPAYVTTLMLLESYLDEFTADRMLTLKEILEGYDEFTNWLSKIHEFRGILNSVEAVEIKQNFKQSLKEAIAHYKVDESVIDLMIENESNLAELRYSAFHAIKELEVCQFSHGSPSKSKPKIYDKVYMFKDINTLLQWMLSVDSGIVLALIQDSLQLSSSYFVFAIRNGGTLSIVTDRERTSHPLREELSRTRARGKAFAERIEQYHFPYSLMDIEFGDNGRAYVYEEKALALREDGVPLKEIRNLNPDEVVWLIMMFSLLSEKFFTNNFKLDKLTYTAKMMQESQLLLQQAEEKGVVLYGYQPLVVNKLTTEDMKTENLKDAFRFEPTGQYDWMIKRYPVPEQAFDVLESPDLLKLTDGAGKETAAVAIKKLSASSFASAERLEKDRIYLARYNQAQVINKQANDEYEKRKEEVKEWFKQAVKKNLPNLLEAIARGKFIVSGDKEEAHTRDGSWVCPQKDGNILRVSMLKGEGFQGFVQFNFGGESTIYNNLTCAVNDSKASLVGHFHPRTAIMLADLCGCDVSELHELLRYWRKNEISRGNHILDRIDPMDWVIHDPWKKVNFDVRIYLSKSGFNELCKKYSTGNEKFWLNTQDNS